MKLRVGLQDVIKNVNNIIYYSCGNKKRQKRAPPSVQLNMWNRSLLSDGNADILQILFFRGVRCDITCQRQHPCNIFHIFSYIWRTKLLVQQQYNVSLLCSSSLFEILFCVSYKLQRLAASFKYYIILQLIMQPKMIAKKNKWNYRRYMKNQRNIFISYALLVGKYEKTIDETLVLLVCTSLRDLCIFNYSSSI